MNLYEKLAAELEKQIKSETYRFGEKLPSVRELHRSAGMSISTILQSLYLLEAKGLVEAQPKRGYYVTYHPNQGKKTPVVYHPTQKEGTGDIEDLIQQVYGAHDEPSPTVNFAIGVPSTNMLPIARLKKIVRETMLDLTDACVQYEPITGNDYLRRQVAQRTSLWHHALSPDDLVTTSGCMNALALALMSITKKGDRILTESPVYFGTLQLAQSLGLEVVEMPTHGEHGLDMEEVKKTLKQTAIAAVIVVSNFSNPLGYSMSSQCKRALVNICTTHQVPLVEEDLYGDVYFGTERPLSCKSFDREGIVLWCSAVSKTLAPGYRVGWIAPGKYRDKVLKTKLYHQVSSPSLSHEVVARFMDKGRYENHLRQLRVTLHHNLLKYLKIIQEYFPENTKTTFPNGGFLLWVELDPRIDTSLLYQPALTLGIKYAPGRMFTLRDQYKNCLRLSFGLDWNEQTATALTKLGLLLQHQLVNY
ncbi:PLP-dependent aminotransferase family protein [Echinicola vietnamensis]|uniref:HTH-type transcriptional regulator NorG n=1 Tax=Echinicola vietnamensis (strain DSM 17526 / LMG 23754 / KMM 6221) TaxID=926556 RepID=L0FZ14_ECHVK|nr:PLP-dependent aminotransferase family protein [Echinicola vietnamensis]AGA77890.1 transcriptional regulator with HTH domain and aminotransferase domain [Echinicola vietnamensis DSM 17526]